MIIQTDEEGVRTIGEGKERIVTGEAKRIGLGHIARGQSSQHGLCLK